MSIFQKLWKFENFVKNRRNSTDFGTFSLFKRHHPVRPESAAILSRAHFWVTASKNRKNRPNFGDFSRKKNRNFFTKNGSLMIGTNFEILWKITQKRAKISLISRYFRKYRKTRKNSIFHTWPPPRLHFWPFQIFSHFFQFLESLCSNFLSVMDQNTQ